MCGIAGTARLGDLGVVQQMIAAFRYRGPDDVGFYRDGEVILGNCRLSIQDLSDAGHMPMESDDGELVVTFNGEIYNFRELGTALEALGHKIRTGTDTEIILHAYQAYGLGCLEHLEGMFAFALWDRRRSRLLLARDRTGMKPLFYHVANGGIAFASELKSMLYLPGFERTVNRRALRSAVRFASNIEEESMLGSVFKLPPGYRLTWQDGRCERAPYWQHPRPAPERWNESELAAEVRTRLDDVVTSHMVSDAPLGAALSGGLDSSAVVALMARHSDRPVDTYTVGHGSDDPDLLYARRVAEHCRTDHHETLVGAEDVVNLLPRLVWHMEEPMGQLESVARYVYFREAARSVKVLLIGEGADELFAGYARYKLLNPALPLPVSTRRGLYERVYMYSDAPPRDLLARTVSGLMWGNPAPSPMRDPFPRAPIPFLEAGDGRDLMERALHFDQTTYLHDLALKRADGLSMAHSLEVRVPFVDRRIAELAARIPGSMLIRGRVEKYILRQAVSALLPSEVVWRTKRGFTLRLSRGILDALDYLCDQLLSPESVRRRGFFDPAAVDALRRSRPGRLKTSMAQRMWSFRICAMVLCELWARLFIDRPPGAPPPSDLNAVL